MQPGRIADGGRSGIACDHYRRFADDFALLRDLKTNGHRLSIEWSRVEPSEGEFDTAAIDHYRQVLRCLRDAGLRSMVTLHHFTSPLWFSRRGGWAQAGSAAAFCSFAARVVDELGELVDWWCTINEPNIYALNGWLTGEFPPGRRADWLGYYRVLRNLRRAHEETYRIVKRSRPDQPVGLSHHKFLLMPASQRRGDRLAARLGQDVLDRWPAGGRRWDRTIDAVSDFVGVAHYWGQLISLDLRSPGDLFSRRSDPPGLRKTDMGPPSDPAWMRSVLVEAGSQGKPVYVTESGISTADDGWRQEYLRAVVAELGASLAAGVPLRGYFHWTSMDNFEWARGYTQQFGLIAVDRSTLERTVKPSGRLYAAIAAGNGLDR